jgi:arylsulfatase
MIPLPSTGLGAGPGPSDHDQRRRTGKAFAACLEANDRVVTPEGTGEDEPMRPSVRNAVLLGALLFGVCGTATPAADIVHDAEYYVLYSQQKEKWEREDTQLDARLEELRKKHGQPPNIVYILWDDTPFGDVGIPHLQKVRGFETPRLNRMAAEGIFFARMYSEPSCTPTRNAVLTGRHPTRNGTFVPGFPIERGGLRGDEVTSGEVLSAAGYATQFCGKGHLGDVEESYLHNQGFDEALFTPYNQVLSLWNPTGEAVNAVLNLLPEQLPDNPYQLDEHFLPKGWVMAIEGKKGEPGKEWRGTSHEDYLALDPECQSRVMEFIRRNAEAKKPFFVNYWPNVVSFMPNPEKKTLGRAIFGEGLARFDVFVGQLLDELESLGIAENTLVIAMADNGPMVHDPPPGLGMTDLIFRGGKGDHSEGGIRVPAFAWWPGVIEPGQIVGDIIHVTDLYTTFARLGGAMKHIPGDRVVDGVDQTALLLMGDTHSRRDYVFVYKGTDLAATIKGNFKRDWFIGKPGMVDTSFFDLLNDTREHHPVMVPLLHMNAGFYAMKARHELMKKKYPDKPQAHGVPFTGLSNARPETAALAEQPKALDYLPFDYREFIEHEIPWDGVDPGVGQ